MIATLEGKIAQLSDEAAIIEIGGVGYEVFVPKSELQKLRAGESAKFFIYDHIREDIHALYGFADPAAKGLFLQLLSVSGVGPKVALAILSSAALQQLQQAIVAGDPELLRGVAGVGKKTAERVIVELRGKVAGLHGSPTANLSSADPTYQALIGLGYSASTAAEAISKLPHDLTDDQARIKMALRELSK